MTTPLSSIAERNFKFRRPLRVFAGKLFEGNEYYFRVAAENAVGISDFVELTVPVVPKPAFSE